MLGTNTWYLLCISSGTTLYFYKGNSVGSKCILFTFVLFTKNTLVPVFKTKCIQQITVLNCMIH